MHQFGVMIDNNYVHAIGAIGRICVPIGTKTLTLIIFTMKRFAA